MRGRPLAMIGMLWMLGCATTRSHETPDAVRARLLDRDREFDAYTATHGLAEGFRAFSAEDVVSLGNNEDAIFGRDALYRSLEGTPPDTTLRWQPRGAAAAESGELGYTWGTWVLHARSRAPEGGIVERHGKYTTIWKKQSDGSWKAVLDMGNASPPPSRERP